MSLPATSYQPQTLPRAIGEGKLSVGADGAVTRVAELRHSGCLKVLMPRTFRADAEAVLVNTAGGITGGDRFDIAAEVGTGAALTLTSQAAERIYRSSDGTRARVETRLRVADGARLQWLPQETILFDGAALDRRLVIDLAPDASLLMCETLVFGRVLMGEVVQALDLRDRVAINRGGASIYRDGIALMGDVPAQLGRAAVAAGAGAVTQVVIVDANAAAHLDPVRAGLPDTGGASLLAEDVMVLRLVAADSFELRKVLLPVLDRLSGGTLPGTWRM